MHRTALWLIPALAACTSGSRDHTNFVALEIHPDGAIVTPDSTLDLRVVAVEADGDSSDVLAEIVSDAPGVFAIDDRDGLALRSGTAELTASWRGMHARATITVRENGYVDVTVVDAVTGAPIGDAVVQTSDGSDETATDGTTRVRAEDRAGVWITASADGYVPVTAYRVENRDLVLPMRPSATETDVVEMTGTVALHDVNDADVGQKVAGLAAANFDAPMLLDIGDLFADNREIGFSGYQVSAPGNIYVAGDAETYELDVPPGKTAVWTLAGPLPVVQFATSLDTTEGAVGVLCDHLDDFSYGFVPAIEADGNQEHVDLAPFADFDLVVDVTVPEIPNSFRDDEQAFVMILGRDERSPGEALLGMALGSGEVEVPRVTDNGFAWENGTRAVAMVQQGGLGSGGARITATATITGAKAALPAWPAPPRAVSFAATTHDFVIETDPRTTLAWVRIGTLHQGERDLIVPGGRFEGRLPDDDDVSVGYGKTIWTVQAIESDASTYVELLSNGEAGPLTAAASASTTAVSTSEFTAAAQ